MSAKRLCTSNDLGRLEDCSEFDINHNGTISINERLPLELVEIILCEAVVAQTLRASTTTFAIKKCSRHDDNLALVCPLWQQIVDGRLFREAVIQRITRIDPKALYKKHADPVKVTGLKETRAVVTMNDNIYTIEYEPNCGPIFVYDMDFIKHRSPINDDNFYELICTNRRPLPAVTGLKNPRVILPSPHENCLFVQPWSTLVDEDPDPQIFKLAHDGTVAAHWYIDQRFFISRMAVDSLGKHVVVSCLDFAHVFTSVGLHIATIPFGFLDLVRHFQILPDSTIIVCFGDYDYVNIGGLLGFIFSLKLVNLAATQTPEGHLEYQDLRDAVNAGKFVDLGLPDTTETQLNWLKGRYEFFHDDKSCCITMLDNACLVTDNEKKPNVAANHTRKKDTHRSHFHFDPSLGLLFFRQYTKLWRRSELCVLHIRHSF